MRIGSAFVCASMANSRFQYVKKFELPDALLQDTYLVTRLDGHRFTKFTAEHGFTKPNDERGLLLMAEVMSEWSDLVMAYGQSDEFSFLLPASSSLYGRSFVFFWPKHFPDTPLLYPPNFDARVVSYPTAEHVRDYFGWRQADCHINNLYNTCFWALVADGESKQDAQVALKGTTSGDKNELLFSRFGMNYNEIPQRFRKGTTLYRARPGSSDPSQHPQHPLPRERLSEESSTQNPFHEGTQAQSASAQGSASVLGVLKDGHSQYGPAGDDCDGAVGREEIAEVGQKCVARVPTVPSLVERKETECNASPALEIQGEEVAVLGEAECRASADTGGLSATSAVEHSAHRAEGGKGSESQVTGSRETSNLGPAADGQSDPQRAKGSGASGLRCGPTQRAAEGGDRRQKRLVKKGHAPPGSIEEDVCDIIRSDFWDRNPHILAGVERRR